MKIAIFAGVLLVGAAQSVLSDPSVYVPPQLGSHIGGGYASSGAPPSDVKTVMVNRQRETPALAKALSHLDAQAGTVVQGYALAMAAVSVQTKVPVDTLRKQQAATKMGASDLLVADSLANGSGKSFQEIMAMQKRAGAWTPLAGQLHVNLKSIIARAEAAASSVRYAEARDNRHREDYKRNILRSHQRIPGN